jgi:uncharacterized MAPEG superfamily protein
VPIRDFRADQIEGEDWYRRAMRAHANCIENLPVFGAIVLALYVSGVGGTVVNYLSISILGARILQSLIHVCFTQTNTVAALRFVFFFIQIASFLTIIIMIFRYAGPVTG